MAAFLKHSEKALEKNTEFTPIANVPKSGRGDTSLLNKASSDVGDTGDSVPNNTRNTASPAAETKVGATGDNAAKKGSGK
jgi:hypothetical protein